MGWGIMRIVEHLEYCDRPTRQNVAWLIFEAASSSPSDVVCVKLLHGGGEGETDKAGIIQSGTPSNSTLTP
jgi:hypothetical protein